MDPGMAMLMQGVGQMMQTFMQGMGRGAGTGSHRDVPNIRIHKKGSTGSLHEHHSPPLGASPVLSARTATDSQPSDVQDVNGEDGFVEELARTAGQGALVQHTGQASTWQGV